MNRGVVKRILGYTSKYKSYLIGAFLFAVISVCLTLLGPVLTGQAIDYIIGKGNVDFVSVAKILIGLICTTAGVSLFQWLMSLCINRVSYYTVRDMRIDAYKKLNNVPLAYIDTNAHGDIISRIINDIDAVGDGLLQGVTQLFSGIITIVGTLGFMVAINFKIAVVVVLVTPLSLFVAAGIARLSAKMFSKQQRTQGEISGFVEEMIGNQKVVSSFSMEEKNEQEFKRLNDELYICGKNAQFASSLANPSTRFVNGIVYAAVGVIGALSAIAGGLTVGQISCFLTYANQYTKPFNEVTGVISQIQTAIAGGARLFELMDSPNKTPDSENAKELENVKGDIEFDNVSFSYTPDRPLIKSFNLKVKQGQRVAIVGPTGCGKTTLINLLMRFYDVCSGEIKIDGEPVERLTTESIRQSFGMVLQDSWLFNGTVRENIAYGREDATDEEIIAAAKAAYAHSFIMHLPNGYDTVITEDGGNLSQGQNQLLCIARVMLSNPPMLILDEATSSIDTLTEQRVQLAFNKMMQGKTSFVVAHRLSTIKEADIILVMKDGNVIEQGKHSQLLRQNGFYAQLYNSQFAKS
ncbi:MULTISPECIES: ABC transporter ATP-binding protein [unclassified Ruminococcus]|uniref:ABC transporter ATP-binding protein n=1 Tax=unclassified Ruminococcus TaxID=2608920 RepID=UPI00210E59CB|nr:MULTISPECIES: ABC transporter ATP-binding protein [unclassified Ruminococcus]MCQ4023103.1 ATP-binding cassette domain-containing protein [Ruminococcus sp. zg-924]MCQ4115540.1 ATP-binding cassette domain-containing protein [Ruminococcus sp. zg-921]